MQLIETAVKSAYDGTKSTVRSHSRFQDAEAPLSCSSAVKMLQLDNHQSVTMQIIMLVPGLTAGRQHWAYLSFL